MALTKLFILAETGEMAVALFNPNQISIAKNTNWNTIPIPGSDTGRSEFAHGNPAMLTLDLFFDTYELLTDVRLFTSQVEKLMTVQHHGAIHRPPICDLVWGASGVFFTGVLTQLNQRFTLFLPTGTPVRATLNCTFKAWVSSATEALLQNLQSPDVAKTRIVRQGDTLSSIAAEEYDDPAQWRPIARANRIRDPLRLQPGQVLAIPVLSRNNSRER